MAANQEYVRITLRVSPALYEEMGSRLEETPDLRNYNDLVRTAIRHYLLARKEDDLEEKSERFLQAPIMGETVTMRFQMPLETYRRIVWLARYKEKMLPIDLMLRYINSGIISLDSEEIHEITKREESYTRALRSDAAIKAKEASWIGR